MSAKKYVVQLTAEGRAELAAVVRAQNMTARQSKRARVLLLSDANHVDGRRPDWQIGEIVGLSEKQIKRIRQQFVQQGLQDSLQRKTRTDAGLPKKIDGEVEAKLVSLCCSDPPEGHQRWTLSLLVDELCRLKVVASVCRETVRQTLKNPAQAVADGTLLHPGERPRPVRRPHGKSPRHLPATVRQNAPADLHG